MIEMGDNKLKCRDCREFRPAMERGRCAEIFRNKKNEPLVKVNKSDDGCVRFDPMFKGRKEGRRIVSPCGECAWYGGAIEKEPLWRICYNPHKKYKRSYYNYVAYYRTFTCKDFTTKDETWPRNDCGDCVHYEAIPLDPKEEKQEKRSYCHHKQEYLRYNDADPCKGLSCKHFVRVVEVVDVAAALKAKKDISIIEELEDIDTPEQ
jgi:hypothetical protein